MNGSNVGRMNGSIEVWKEESYLDEMAEEFERKEMKRIEDDIMRATESFIPSAEATLPPWSSNGAAAYREGLNPDYGKLANPEIMNTRPRIIPVGVANYIKVR
jgi:hypothetical protein